MANKNFTKLITIILSLVILFSALTIAGCDDSDLSIDSSGNMATSDYMTYIKSDKDFNWAGLATNSVMTDIGYDASLAGVYMRLANGKVNGNIRAAGGWISLDKLKVSRNIYAAALKMDLKESTFDTATVFAKDMTFTGACKCIHFAGDTLTIDGTVLGDVSVSANKVIVKKNAKITGIIEGTLKSKPVIENSAYVDDANIEIVTEAPTEKTENKTSETIAPKTKNKVYAAPASALDIVKSSIKKEVQVAFSKIIPLGDNKAQTNNEQVKIEDKTQETPKAGPNFGTYWWLLAAILLWLFMRLVMRKSVTASGKELIKSPVKMPVTGLVVLIVLPITSLFILLTIIGLPISFIGFVMYGLLWLISIPFAGSAVGELVFAKVTPKMNAWFSTLTGTFVMYLLCEIPYVNVVFRLACAIFTIGYFALALYKGQIKKEKK